MESWPLSLSDWLYVGDYFGVLAVDREATTCHHLCHERVTGPCVSGYIQSVLWTDPYQSCDDYHCESITGLNLT